MSVWRQLYSFYGPFLLILAGALGTLYCGVTGLGGNIPLALSLIMLLVGITLVAGVRVKRNEFFARHFGGEGKPGSRSRARSRKRIGKKCPGCERVIHHRRTVCQHCGYEFPSNKYKKSLTSTVVDSE